MSKEQRNIPKKQTKQEFLADSYERSQSLHFNKAIEKRKKHLSTTINYFLDDSVEKKYSGSYVALNDTGIKYKSKQRIYKPSTHTDEIEVQMRKLFNSIVFPITISDEHDLCIRFKIKYTPTNFYITRINNRYSLTWGIDHNSVRVVSNEPQGIDELS